MLLQFKRKEEFKGVTILVFKNLPWGSPQFLDKS